MYPGTEKPMQAVTQHIFHKAISAATTELEGPSSASDAAGAPPRSEWGFMRSAFTRYER